MRAAQSIELICVAVLVSMPCGNAAADTADGKEICAATRDPVARRIANVPHETAARISPYLKFRSSFLMGWRATDGAAIILEQRTSGEPNSRLLALGQPTESAVVLRETGDGIADAETAIVWKRVLTTDAKDPSSRNESLSSDGRERVYVQADPSSGDVRHSRATSIWIQQVAMQKAEKIEIEGAAQLQFSSPKFGADARAVLVLATTANGRTDLLKFDRASRQTRNLTAQLKGDVVEFAVSGANTIAVTVNESGSSVLRFFELASGKEKLRPALFEGAIDHLHWQRSREVLGFSMASARAPAEVYSYDLNSTKLLRWTNGAVPGLSSFNFAEPQRIEWASESGKHAGHFWLPDVAAFPGQRPVMVLLQGQGKQRAVGFLGADNYLVAESGVAMVRPDSASMSALRALLEWIQRQPNLDASRVVISADTDASAGVLAALEAKKLAVSAALVERDEMIGLQHVQERVFVEKSDGIWRRATLRNCGYGADASTIRLRFLESVLSTNKKGGQ